MLLFRLLLIAMLSVLAVYTTVVMANHGPNLIPIFFADIGEMGWPGQFNMDFMGFLILSALWTAWRHRFTAMGLALSIVAFFGGMMFLTVYLFVTSIMVRGDVRALLLGSTRSAQ